VPAGYHALVSAKLSINRRDDDKGVVLVLSGELDIASAPALEQSLNEILSEGTGPILLDLNELRFVDSAGVTVLIRAKRDAETKGRSLSLRRPSEQLRQVFSLVGLADWLAVGEA
jgi:anti-anti-sigma factor